MPRRHVPPKDKPPRYENMRRMWDTRWTLLTDEFRIELEKVITEAGGIGSLSEIIGIKARHIRRLRRGHGKAVSFRVCDQIFGRSDRSLFLLDLPWYTVEELQGMHIWNPPFGNYDREMPDIATDRFSDV